MTQVIMTNQELIKLLKMNGYRKVTLETDNGEPRTFYTYRGGLHINATGNLSFHIVPPSQSLGLGRFATCATRGLVFSTPAGIPARESKRGRNYKERRTF